MGAYEAFRILLFLLLLSAGGLLLFFIIVLLFGLGQLLLEALRGSEPANPRGYGGEHRDPPSRPGSKATVHGEDRNVSRGLDSR